MSNCFYCNNNNMIINKTTSYCNNCNLVYIKDHYPYNIDIEINDKYEEYKYKF